MTGFEMEREMVEVDEFGPCSLCEQNAIVVINDQPFCMDHVDDGFTQTFRAIAILKGADPDVAEHTGMLLRGLIAAEDADSGTVEWVEP